MSWSPAMAWTRDAQHLQRRRGQPVLRRKAVVGVVARQHDEIERGAKFDFDLRDD